MISACGPRGRHSFWAFLPLSGTTRARLTDFFHCFVSSTFTFFLHLQSDRRLRRRNMTRRPLVIFTDAEAEYFYACARVRTQWSFFFLMMIVMINVCSLFLRDLGDWNTPKCSSLFLSHLMDWGGRKDGRLQHHLSIFYQRVFVSCSLRVTPSSITSSPTRSSPRPDTGILDGWLVEELP